MRTRPSATARHLAARSASSLTALVIALLAMLAATTTVSPAAAAGSGCDNPDDLPVMTVGAKTFHAPAPAMPATISRASDATSFSVIIDMEGAAAGTVTADIDWATPADHFAIRLIDGDGDATYMGWPIARTSTGERTRNAAFGLVADCETVTVEVAQFYGGPPREMPVEVRVEPHDAAPPRDLRVHKGDVTVIAMVDDGFNPYHHEFRADRMPGGNGLPLDRPPHEWISGFPSPDDFADYRPLDLTLPDDPEASVAQARADDDAVWASTSQSEPDAVNYHWVPGTKYVGAVDFSGNWQTDDNLDVVTGEPSFELNDLHGSATTGVAAGNTVGHCPECVIVMVVTDQHERDRHDLALRWASSQPWIDVVVDAAWVPEEHSGNHGPVFAPINSGIDLTVDAALSLEAHERGQQHFIAAGNGLTGMFNVPHTTMFADPGLDWVTTVTGVGDDGSVFTGSVRGADLAGIQESQNTTRGPTMTSRSATFGGTSAAAPQIGGTYARALALTRAALPGASRAQDDGVVATGGSGRCAAVPDCPLADGRLTRAELLDHLHAAARLDEPDLYYPGAGGEPGASPPRTPVERDHVIATLGHGVIRGRDFGDVAWHDAMDRIVAPVLGERRAEGIPADVVAHQTVDSYCRQQWWGDWDEGYFRRGETALPGPDAERPQRTALEAGCTAIVVPVGGMGPIGLG